MRKLLRAPFITEHLRWLLLLIFQEVRESLRYIKITEHIALSAKTQRVDSVIADLKLKKKSSLRMFEINTSRIGKPPKLASEKYGKRKKRKFTYQEPPLFDAELNKLFEGATKAKPTEKKKQEGFVLKIYMFKVNNRNTRTRCEIFSKLTKKIPERRHWRRSAIFIVNFEHIPHLVPVFLL